LLLLFLLLNLFPELERSFKKELASRSYFSLLRCDSIARSTLCMKCGGTSNKNVITTRLQPYSAKKSYNYIFTLLSTIEIIIIYFNTFCCIPYFQLLLLCVVISFHDVRKYFPEVRVAVSLCVSLTDEVSI
jgi:hypothetical protein